MDMPIWMSCSTIRWGITMKDYRVLWEITLSADSAVLAAIEALNIQRDINSLATFFIVRSNDGYEEFEVDLDRE
jgi:hypothetical protein